MKKELKFIIVTLWIVLSRGYDAYCTSILTPDLSHEANPLVSIFGLTWTPLLIVLTILIVYTVYCYYISVFKPINLLPTKEGYSFSNVVAYTFLGQKDEWYSMFYKVPNSLTRFNNYIGHLLPLGLAFAGIVSTVMWLLINNIEGYYETIHSAKVVYAIIIVGSIGIIYFWNKRMYQQYLNYINSKH